MTMLSSIFCLNKIHFLTPAQSVSILPAAEEENFERRELDRKRRFQESRCCTVHTAPPQH